MARKQSARRAVQPGAAGQRQGRATSLEVGVRAAQQILDLLGSGDTSTINTSMRIPTALRDAAVLAVNELGTAESATALTADALRATLEAVAMQATLDAHYEQYADARPSLADLAISAAEIDGHRLAERPDVLRRAAEQIVERHPHADADDVIMWAEAQQLATA